MRLRNFNTRAALVCALAFMAGSTVARADWSVDLSRRTKVTRDSDLLASPSTPNGNANGGRSGQGAYEGDGDRAPASVGVTKSDALPPHRYIEEPVQERASSSSSKGFFDMFFEAGEPVQDIVILQTERGFVPATVRVRKNGHYRVSVVNVNEKEKNVSFILDGFSEHHATYYGKIKTFSLEPKKEGSYSFQSPETSAEGKLIVFNPQITVRAPAGAANEGGGSAK